MNEITLPPAPNWYLSSILACSRRGTVAWGAKNYIVIAKRKENSDILQYSLLKDFTKSKINSLAFCPKIPNSDDSDCPELLICSGDDDKVKIWNIDTLELTVEFSFSDGKPLVAVDWSTKDDNLAYAINSDSFLMCCNIQYKTMKKVYLGKLLPTCLACCPHDASLVAIGSKNGLIYVVQKEVILYRMRGHDKEVVSLSWCPSEMNVLSGEDKADLLLASGAKDRFVYIWRAGSDGRYETVINLPYQSVTSSFSQHRNKSTVETWVAVCWAEPKLLLTTSLCGEILCWDLFRNKNNKHAMHQLFYTHYTSRGLFCIVNVPKTDANNWRADSDFTVWIATQDRWVVCCRKQHDKPFAVVDYKIPTQGGYVYCMEACPIDTSRIAFGVGDMVLRMWNSSEPHTTSFDLTMHWQKIKGKLRALSWMPNEESVVAFGTGEGRVGVFEAIGTNKLPILFRQYHRNTVYKLEWAQLELDYFLFSCAEGELIAYKKSAPLDEPRSIIKKGCTEFAWKSNLCMAVALENGAITFYNQKLKKCSNTIHILRSTINCMVWHPDSTATDEWTSPFANYLAVASDSHSIIIFDVSELIKELEATKDLSEEKKEEEEKLIDENNKQVDYKLHKIAATLNGHSDRVVCLAWSPHLSGFLVSGGYDKIAQVWNVEKQELLGTFSGHDGPVLSCMWSPLKPQLIMTGSVDFTLRIWDYTSPAQSPVHSTHSTSTKKKHKQQKKIMGNGMDSSAETHNLNGFTESQSTTSKNHSVETVKSDNSQVSLKDTPKPKGKKYFVKYNSLSNNSNILDLIKNDIRNNQEQNETNDIDSNEKMSLFSEQTAFLNYLARESSEHRARGNTSIALEMDIWHCNLKEILMTAVKNYQLNDFLISLAPNLSIKIWKEMCEAYAQQLVSEGNVEKAVSYLLCIHKIYEAIQTFVDAKMYKEAYALARCKLDADDPVLESILKSWSEKDFANGNFEQAAHCYVQLGQFDKAAEALARRKNVHCLEIASELAFLSGDERYGTSLIVDAMTRALVKSDWSKARSLIAQIRKIQYLNVYIDAHEAITSTYRKQSKLEAVRAWLKGNGKPGVLQALTEKYDVSYNEVLCNNANTNAALRTEMDDTMMHLNISYQVAIATTSDKRETQLHHIAKILSDAFEYEDTSANVKEAASIFTHIFTKLDTKGPMEETSIYGKSNYPVSQSIRAYLCIGLLKWLLDQIEKLSSEEETELTEMILDLLDDAINETTLAHQKTISDCKQAEDSYIALLHDVQKDITDDDDEYKKVKNDLDKLYLEKKKFIKDRVCTPNPINVFHTAGLVANKLHDDNRSRFTCYIDKLTKEVGLEMEVEEITSKRFEELTL